MKKKHDKKTSKLKEFSMDKLRLKAAEDEMIKLGWIKNRTIGL